MKSDSIEGVWKLNKYTRRFLDTGEVRTDMLRRNFFRRFDLQPEAVAVEMQRRREILDRDTDVVEHGFHFDCPTALDSRSCAAV